MRSCKFIILNEILEEIGNMELATYLGLKKALENAYLKIM